MDEDVERLLDAFREIASIESRHDFVEDGLYKGCTVRYTNGTEMFHPYIPLTITSVNGPVQWPPAGEYVSGGRRFRNGYPVYVDMMPSPSSEKH